MAVYTYLFQDTLTGNVLGTIPVNGVSFDRQLNRPGNFQGSTNLDNDFTSNDDIISMTEPGKSSVYVYRDDNIVWGGIIWTRSYQSQAKALQFTAQTYESYAYRRIFKPTTTVKYNMAQCRIIRDLWFRLQQDENSGVGVNVPAIEDLPDPDVTRNYVINPWDMRNYGEIIESITDFDNGADYFIECYEESAQPSKRLYVGYPRLGAIIAKTDLIVDYPGNVLNFYWTENANEGATRFYATGDGDEGAMKIGRKTDLGKLSNGYLLTEATNSYQGVTSQATIDAHAQSDLANNGLHKVKKQFELSATEHPEFGSYGLGDDARVILEDARFPEKKDFAVRVVGWNVTPSSSDSTEEVRLVLEGDDESA